MTIFNSLYSASFQIIYSVPIIEIMLTNKKTINGAKDLDMTQDEFFSTVNIVGRNQKQKSRN